ncbi:hypothetical protein M413DRAFT_347359 [Hebeloma cylindrosporum]|uniref:F-box domain-containing protein n=1 Tax=Hebeloma cylindrosporum TaxID=76867 RepID=A0A0C3BFZ9_HEBCY|nr:hypothetical protein M413DRAFT_347359 [Hebeloma cylindrosporum h7]
MVLYTRRELEMETRVRVAHCGIAGGGPCSACKEAMEVEQKIQELQQRHRQLRTKMNANHDPFVLKLPPEIASHIFVLSMDNLKTKTPYLFGSVCRGWRQLARSTPQLWSKLAFFFPSRRMDSTFMENPPHLVVDWLERSGGLPLSLQVSYYPSGSPQSPPKEWLSIINVLNQHSGRWHDLVFDLPLVYFRHFRPTSPPQNLRNVSIFATDDPDAAATDISERPSFIMNARLGPMKFRVDGIPLKAVDVAWESLVQLEVTDASLDGVLEVIRSAPLLEKCCLADISPPTVGVSETIIYHSRLRTLELYQLHGGVFTELINLLELPSLESWLIDSELEQNVIAVDAASFLRRSGPGLKSLELYQRREKPPFEDFTRLLHAAPHLQSLKLEGDGLPLVMDNILEQMSAPPASESQSGHSAEFLPELRSLELVSSELTTWECIPRIFRWPHRKLLRLDIEMGTVTISDEVSNELVRLVDQGFKLCIYEDLTQEDYLQVFREHGALEYGM